MEISKKKLVTGMDKVDFSNKDPCKTCMMSKIHVKPFPHESKNRVKELLQLLHTYACGPFRTSSLGGSKFFLTFIDDKSRRIFVYFMKRNDEVFEKFVEFKKMAERQTGKMLKCIRIDRLMPGQRNGAAGHSTPEDEL